MQGEQRDHPGEEHHRQAAGAGDDPADLVEHLGVLHDVEVVEDQQHPTRQAGQALVKQREHAVGRLPVGDRAASGCPSGTAPLARSARSAPSQNDVGLSMLGSSVSHAIAGSPGGIPEAIHRATAVVLPQPGPAEITVTR